MIDFDKLCADLPIQNFEDGDIITTEGQKLSCLYILKSGKVATFRGDEKITELDQTGTVLGEVAALLDCPTLAQLIAVGPTCFYVVENVESFLLEKPELALHVSHGLAKKMHFMASYLTDLKKQYADSGNHMGMVHEVLDSFLHQKS